MWYYSSATFSSMYYSSVAIPDTIQGQVWCFIWQESSQVFLILGNPFELQKITELEENHMQCHGHISTLHL